MPSFVPACAVNITVRFDEALTLLAVPNPSTIDTASIKRQPASVSPTPLITKRGVKNSSHILNRIPKHCSVELPGYRQAGQFSCDFAFSDLPIDPRAVRAASVEIHMGTVSPELFARGVTARESNGSRLSYLRTRTSAGQPNLDTLRMVGLVDEWSINHSGTDSIVSFRGRDLRGILIDTPISTDPQGTTHVLDAIDQGQPINEVVTQILRFCILFNDITVSVNPAEWPGGTVPTLGGQGTVPRHRQGANGTKKSGHASMNSSSSELHFWDLITRYCYLVGAIPYFQGNQLLIRPSRSIFDQARGGIDPTIPTPFAGAEARGVDAQSGQVISPSLRIRRLAYGRDVESMSFDRKYGGYQRPRVVRAVSIDSSSKRRGAARMVEGRWPQATESESARSTRVAPGGAAAHEEILNIPVPGIRDSRRLQEVARAVYEEIGRGEMGGSVVTKNLASFGGDNADPDLVRLSPGDAIELMVDTRVLSSSPPLVSTFTNFARDNFEKVVADVRARIGDENLARVIVATARGQIQELQRYFRVSTVKLDWSQTGIKVSFDFQNYVVVRDQIGQSTTQARGRLVRRAAPSTVSSPRAPLYGARGRLPQS